jgi:hypothetical protein
VDVNFDRLVSDFRPANGRSIERASSPSPFPCAPLTDHAVHSPGRFLARPEFTLVIRDPSALRALETMDISLVGEAFLRGALDVEGELWRALALRELFVDRRWFTRALHYIRPTPPRTGARR